MTSEQWEQTKKEMQKKLEGWKQPSNMLKTGDIFYTSWGYDQTNYEYITIMELSKSGKTVICQRVKSKHLGFSGCSNEQKPLHEPFGDKFRMRVQAKYNNDNEKTLRGSYPFCCDASMNHTRLGTFWKADERQTFYETDAQFGH